jgi:hypothetical protein
MTGLFLNIVEYKISTKVVYPFRSFFIYTSTDTQMEGEILIRTPQGCNVLEKQH